MQQYFAAHALEGHIENMWCRAFGRDTVSSFCLSLIHISRTILGPAENIRTFSRAQILDYRSKHYYGENIVVAAVGNYDIQKLLAELEETLKSVPSKGEGRKYVPEIDWKPVKKEFCVHKDIEQAHLGIAFPGPGIGDADRYAFSILANVLGGGMSSRLFQKVREELGAAYSVYAYPSMYCLLYTSSTQCERRRRRTEKKRGKAASGARACGSSQCK